MILKIYTVHDSAVGAFMSPFFARSHGEALRSFQDAINDPKTNLNSHPHDYHLFYVGAFDDNAATLDMPSAPERLLSGTEALISDLKKTS